MATSRVPEHNWTRWTLSSDRISSLTRGVRAVIVRRSTWESKSSSCWESYKILADPLKISTTMEGLTDLTVSPLNALIWPVRKTDGCWRMAVDDYDFNEGMARTAAAVSEVVSLLG